jgi:hypothetical protein
VAGVHVRRKVRKGGNPEKGKISGNRESTYRESYGQEGKRISVFQSLNHEKEEPGHWYIIFSGVGISRIKQDRRSVA